jgi:adenosylmethionine---8-amino-7-oxononanoate aminotransferase
VTAPSVNAPDRSANAGWLERSLRAVWHPCTQMKSHETLPLVPIEHGDGAWLYDFEGRRYLDAVSSWWVNLFGHANPRIGAALKDQLDRLPHVLLAGFTHAPVVELSERLSALAPGNLGHAFYGSDGASATEIALKMSFHCWRNRGRPEKCTFVSLAGSYHGETLGALAVTDLAIFRDAYAPLLARHATVPSPDARAAEAGESARDVAERAALALETHLAAHHGTTAALIVEPLVQGACGMAMHDPHYLARARELCSRYDVHLIADEIMTGFGRTGTLFAWEQVVSCAHGQPDGVVEAAPASRTGASPTASAGAPGRTGTLVTWEQVVSCAHGQPDGVVEAAPASRTGTLFACDQTGIAPDFLLLSKGITGGYLPLACVLTTDAVFQAFYDDDVARGFLHSHSYTGNALACRAALAVLDIFRDDDVIEKNRGRAQRWAAIAAPIAAHPKVRAFRRCGMIWAFEVESGRPDFARWCFAEGLARGILLRPIGRTVYWMPPYVVSDEEFRLLAERTHEIVDLA